MIYHIGTIVIPNITHRGGVLPVFELMCGRGPAEGGRAGSPIDRATFVLCIRPSVASISALLQRK